MRILFDGLLIDNLFLKDVGVAVSEVDSTQFDVVAKNGDNNRVLETFDTEREAKDYVNRLGQKMSCRERRYAESGDIQG